MAHGIVVNCVLFYAGPLDQDPVTTHLYKDFK